MKKIVKKSPEELSLHNLQYSLREMEHAIEIGMIPLNPTRSFEIGERVSLGALEEVYVREIRQEGLFYVCEAMNVKRDRDKPASHEFHVDAWHEIYKYGKNKETQFTQEEKYRIRLLNSPVESLLHMVYASHAGVDFDVEYQRGHVWSIDDKVDLIDSIYNNIDIGKFVFIQLNEKTTGKYYQVLDGKQRLTALCEFYEDRFPYKGVYFSQMSHRDKHTFTSHGITYGFLENPDKRAVYESFIKLNTCGKPMDHKHIDKVKELINNLDNG